MRANQFQPVVSVERSTANKLQDRDRAVEQIAGNNGEFVFAHVLTTERVHWMHEQRHVKLDGHVIDWPEKLLSGIRLH